jgi:hypothetical protein
MSTLLIEYRKGGADVIICPENKEPLDFFKEYLISEFPLEFIEDCFEDFGGSFESGEFYSTEEAITLIQK